MKVALLSFFIPEYAVQLANGLANHAEVTLIQSRQLTSVWQAHINSRVTLVCLDKPRIRSLRSISYAHRILNIVKDIRPDVVHLQESNDPWFDCLSWMHNLTPLVTTVHDVNPHPGDGQSSALIDLTRRINIRRSSAVIVHSKQLKADLHRRFGVPSEKISCLPLGEFGSLYMKAAAPTEVSANPLSVLFFGRIWQYKGLNVLIKAMDIVRQTIPQAKLVIAGRGEPIQRYLPNNYDRNCFEVIDDFIPVSEVAPLFRRCAVVALPYVEASQSGVTAIAMATGTPIVASRVGGLAELINHGVNGLLVEPSNVEQLASAITRLLSDASLRARLSDGAQKVCDAELSWNKISKRTFDLYQAITHRRTSLVKTFDAVQSS